MAAGILRHTLRLETLVHIVFFLSILVDGQSFIDMHFLVVELFDSDVCIESTTPSATL